MTDEELIARARLAQRYERTLFGDLANRIEALTKERDEAKAMQSCGCSYDTPNDVCLGHHRLFERLYAVQRGRLEAKLAEAVEALEHIAAEASVPVRTKKKGGIKHKWMYRGWRKIAVERIDIARATLAGIKGESHD